MPALPGEGHAAAPPPLETVQAEVAALRSTGEATTVPAEPDKPLTVGANQPNLLDFVDSPYGAPVRAYLTAGDEDIMPDAFAVLDVRHIVPEQLNGQAVRRLPGVTITDPRVTHLLVGEGFGDDANQTGGFKGLRPGQPFAIGRLNPVMGERFGLTPMTRSTVSSEHGEISVNSGGGITFTDLGSKNGTLVTSKPAAKLHDGNTQPYQPHAADPVNAQAKRFKAERTNGLVRSIGRKVVGDQGRVVRANILGQTPHVRR